MKTLKSFLGISFIVTLALLTNTSCSESNETKDNCYFTLGIEDVSLTTSDLAERTAITNYEYEIESAYLKAVGMTSSNTLLISGDFSKVAAQMKTKFESTVLPTAPTVSKSTYSFKYVLSGADLKNDKSSSNTVIVSKTFTNK